MPIEAPKIDKRTFDDIVDETAKWAEEFTDWQRPADDKPDAGLALIRIFAGMASQVIDRLNQVPEKNFLAFLDLIGTQIQPPQPARVPLTFLPAAGTGEDSFMQVPANTQAAAPPLEGEEEEVIFETQRDLVLTTARLTSVFVRQPDADGYADYTALATGVVYDAFPAFEGDQPIEHSLYLAHDEFFTLAAPKTITLTFDSPDAARLAKLPITWSYWDGVTWQPLSRSSGIDTGLTVTFEDPPIAKVKRGKAIDGQGRKIELTEDQTVDLGTYFGSTVLVVISYSEEPSKPPVVQAFPESDVALYPVETYLRLARLVVDSEGGISESVKSKPNGAKWTVTIEDLPVSAPRPVNEVEASWLRAQLAIPLPTAWSGQQKLDLSQRFYPFGTAESPTGPFDLYLEPILCSIPDAASDPPQPDGTPVTLHFTLATPGVPSYSKPVLVWKYFQGDDAWMELGRSTPQQASSGTTNCDFNDGTQAFTQTGTVSFTVPTDVPDQTLHDLPGRWLRVEISAGGFKTPPQVEPMLPPIDKITAQQIDKITAQVKVEGSGLAPDQAFANSVPLDLSKDFYPFGEQPRFNDTFYLASAEVFSKPGAQVTVNLALSDPPPMPLKPSCDLEIAWEAWDGRAWQQIIPPSTTLAQEAGQNSQTLEVESTEGFAVGDCIRIDPGGDNPEDNTITEIEKKTFKLQTQLGNTHAAGTRVVVIYPSTTLAQEAGQNSQTLEVKSTGGFAEGDCICIDPGGAEPECNRIKTLDESKREFALENPLSSDHKEGTCVCVISCSSASFLCSGPVTFTLPSELGQRTINGQTAYWIRARIVRGNFGTPEKPVWNAQEIKMTGGFGPPSVASLSLSYAYEADGPLTACKTCNDFTFEDHTQTAAVANDTTFRPFQPCADTQPSLYLGFDRRFANRSMTLYARVDPLQPGQVADRGVAEPARVIWEYAGPDERWHHLGARDETNAFTESGLIQFSGPTDLTARAEFGRELYWLRARQERGKFPVPPRLRRLLTNTTWASQATTIPDEILGSSSGEPNQVFRTTRWPVLLDPRIEVREPGPVSGAAPGIESEQGEQASGRPADTGGGWRQVPNFYASGPGDRHYVLDHLSGKVHFGDGRRGAIPPPGRILAARYRTGGGRRGTRSAGQITQLKSAVPYVAGVTNHQAAAGGVEQQDLEHVREYGPRAIRHRGYAVTRQDVEDLAYEASTEVARAKTITPRVPPSHQPLDLWLDPRADSPDTSLHEKVTEAGVMRLIVVPRVEGPQPIPSLGLLEQVKAYLKARCPATTDLLRVDEPDWVEVTVKAEVVPTSSAMANVLPARLKAALERFLHPLTGGPLGNGWPFGRLPYLSDLYALVESVESVDHVRTLTIDSARQITERSLIFSGRHEIKMAPVTE